MKYTIISVLLCLGLTLTNAFANYIPSPELTQKLETASAKIHIILDSHSEDYRQEFIDVVELYKTKYSENQKALYVLEYISSSLSEKSQPNILLIIADDMGLDASPGYTEGTTKAPMPNLEDMVTNGLVFENFLTAPTCTPTRSTMLTGKYGIRTNVLAVDDPLSLSEKPLQSFLPEAYTHAVIGKWHLSKDAQHPNEIGIDYYAGLLSGGVRSYWDWTLTKNGTQTKQNDYITSVFTDLAIDWTQQQENPWFLWLAYTSPHTPFHLPPTDLHSSDSLDPSESAIEDNPLPYYHAMLESLDTEIGRFLSSMTPEVRDNTIIVFMGDNGTPNQVVQSPFPRRKAKGSLYQGGINTPLIISGAGVTRNGERETALVNSADMFASVLELSGVNLTNIETHDSKSFAGLINDDQAISRDFAYAEVGGESRHSGYTIRNDTWKYLSLDSGDEFLFNLKNDPYEQENLINISLTKEQSTQFYNLKNHLDTIRE